MTISNNWQALGFLAAFPAFFILFGYLYELTRRLRRTARTRRHVRRLGELADFPLSQQMLTPAEQRWSQQWYDSRSSQPPTVAEFVRKFNGVPQSVWDLAQARARLDAAPTWKKAS